MSYQCGACQSCDAQHLLIDSRGMLGGSCSIESLSFSFLKQRECSTAVALMDDQPLDSTPVFLPSFFEGRS